MSGLARSGVPVQARGPMDANNIHLTGWYRNPANGSPQSYGVAGNANRMIGSQYTAETFYRFHITPNFAITPDFQLIQHPALNPRVDTMWVTSVRARLVF